MFFIKRINSRKQKININKTIWILIVGKYQNIINSGSIGTLEMIFLEKVMFLSTKRIKIIREDITV